MKILFASDIHGCAPSLEAVLNLANKEEAALICFLGDLLYHGPRNPLPFGYDPKACISLYNSCAGIILAVKGNCDSEADQEALGFPIQNSAALFVDGKRFHLFHGHQNGEGLKLSPGCVAASGHTHIPYAAKENGVYRLNPGSAALPKGGAPKSAMAYENGACRFFDLEQGRVFRAYQF